MNKITLKPTYWASVSGGKDSLYMLYYIFNHLDLYPLDGVVHFSLEIDYPFVKDVVSYMKDKCFSLSIPFITVSPTRTWEDIYFSTNSSGFITGFPTRAWRWCNSKYKLSAKQRFVDFKKSLGYNTIFYIGYCFDEFSRYKHRSSPFEIYPLVDARIYEADILDWAKKQSIFNDYYKYNNRCGCMYCPLTSMKNFAYLYKYYPNNYNYMIEKMRETEHIRSIELNRPFSVISSNPKYNADYLDNIVKTKYIHYLDDSCVQLSIFDTLSSCL